jgi:hypothetical protein
MGLDQLNGTLEAFLMAPKSVSFKGTYLPKFRKYIQHQVDIIDKSAKNTKPKLF